MTNAPVTGRESDSKEKKTSTSNSTLFACSPRPLENILSRLGHVVEKGDGRWMARCPAHDDRRPSLSVSEGSNGVVGLYCHAGCETTDVLDAIASDFSDLYPADIRSPRPERYSDARLTGREIVSVLSHELTIIEIAAKTMMIDPTLSPDDAERLALACSRIRGVVLDVSR